LIDTDPAFTQVRHLRDVGARTSAEAHTAFFTFAERMGRPDCLVPDDGFPWQPTRQPVVLDLWDIAPPPPSDAPFTTVMQWASYDSAKLDGRRYGTKAESFAPVFDLPRKTPASLELAVGGESAPRDELEASGWRLRDSRQVTITPWMYQDYIRASRGEFSVAKEAYVATRSGWFSERSTGYLASGRPIVVEDTGFSDVLPVGAGIVPFRGLAEAVAGLEAIVAEYDHHRSAARRIAEEHFDSNVVLSHLIERMR
jgi:hypothetical protein